MIMVDELQVWPNAWGIFRNGSSHLTTDGPIEELHAFAAKIGLRLEWFQNHRVAPHYDLTPRRREMAIKQGAIVVSMREQIRQRRAATKPSS